MAAGTKHPDKVLAPAEKRLALVGQSPMYLLLFLGMGFLQGIMTLVPFRARGPELQAKVAGPERCSEPSEPLPQLPPLPLWKGLRPPPTALLCRGKTGKE